MARPEPPPAAQGVKQIVPDGTKIGRIPELGQTDIDDLYKVARPDVDYVVIEYKFDKSALGNTTDGKQMSDAWLRGDKNGLQPCFGVVTK